MTKLLNFIGTAAFYLTIPALYFYIKKDERSRLIVVHDDKVLVLQAWYGPNKWMLPGGGIHKGEEVTVAATRELFEETGIVARPEDLQFVRRAPVGDSYGLKHVQNVYVLALDNRPELRIPNKEIRCADWRYVPELIADERGVLRATRRALQAWSEA